MALCCGRRYGKCLSPDTRIALSDGTWKKITDLSVGDLVPTLNEETYAIEEKPILHVIANGKRDTVIVKTASRKIRCTPNHPILVNNSWMEAGDIRERDLVGVPKALPRFGEFSRPGHEVDFMAIWLAEGRGSLISNTTPAIMDCIRNAATFWGMKVITADGNEGVTWRVTFGLGTGQKTPENGLRKLLDADGLYERDSKTKFIPSWVYTLPRQQLARFLNLFVACDGTVTQKCKTLWSMEIGLANEGMVRQLSELFLKFGIRGQIYHKIHAANGKSGEPFQSWSYIVCESVSLAKFCLEVGALSKEDKVAGALKSALESGGTCNTYLPISYEQACNHLKYTPDSRGDARSSSVVPFDLPRELKDILRSWRKQTPSRVSEKRYRQLAAYLDDYFDSLVGGDVAWEEVIGVENGGEIETFDLTIEDNHNFIAEGFITHNTLLDATIAADGAAKGQLIGVFAPEHKITTEFFREIADTLAPIKKQSSMTAGVFRTKTGGRVDFWTLENERAGRSRKYHKVIIDEAAFGKNNVIDIWERAIRPTLVDYGGTALVTSTPNGANPDNFFYKICNDPKYNFKVFKAPTHDNPFLSQEELKKLETDYPPLVYKQEFLAEFVDWSGDAFFSLDSLLENGQPCIPPARSDAVFAIIDTAVKTGKHNDGTAVIYCLYNRVLGRPLLILDYDIVQIEGALLETWLPTVFQNLEHLAKLHQCRNGSLGAYIEDQNAGSILIQQAKRRGWPAQAIDSKLASVGKDERAISVSGYVYRKMVGLTQTAYDKTMDYKGTHRNHLIGQVCGFHVGVDNITDDLLDCFTYGISIALGDTHGF